MSLESMGAVALSATEINRGMNWIYYNGAEALDARVKVLLDFSYTVMGFLGVAWDKIDWDNPEVWFKQAEEKQKALDNALKEKAELEKKFKDDYQTWLEEMATKEKAIKSKEAELVANNGKWSAKFSWWVKILVALSGVLCIIFVLWWIYTSALKMLAGLPFKAAFFGGSVVAKGFKQVVEGLQEARVKIKERIKLAKDDKEKQVLDDAWKLLHENLGIASNDDVKELIDGVKIKNKMKKTVN